MFCQSCGAEAAPGLSYCKRCGARVNLSADRPAKPRVTGLIWAVSLSTGLVALGGCAVILGLLVEVGADVSNRVLTLLLLFLLVVLVIEVLFIRLLSRLIGVYLQAGNAAQPEQPKLGAQPPAQLDAPRGQPTAEVDQATRLLDARPTEREPR